MKDIWTVKYRPQTLDTIVGNEQAVTTILQLVSSNNLPHLVLHGPGNSGKSSVAFALARQLYGQEWERNLTYFNASDFFDQGKRYLVRDKRFVRIIGTDEPSKIRKSVIAIFKQIVNEYASVAPIDHDYKIIFIDNAEALNSDAQHALRRIMEKYTTTCRFILSTTQPSKLIAPLRSRGLQLFFTHVSDHKLEGFIRNVIKTEELSISDDGMDALVYHSKGNVAKALITLQLASLQAKETSIGPEIIYEIVLSETPEDITALFEAASSHDVMAARKIIDKLLIEDGLTGAEILEKLYEVAIQSNEPEADIARSVIKMAQTDMNLTEAANDRIHLEALIADF